MSKTSNFFKTTAILSTALFTLLGGCLVEEPIDYTTATNTVSDDGAQQDTDVFDSTAPTAVSVLIDNGAASTNTTAVTLDMSATDDVAVTDYYASESAATPQASDSGWESYQQSTAFTLSGSNSLGVFQRTVNVWFKDAAGNVSESVDASISLGVYDTTAPNAVSVVIDNGTESTSNATVTLTLSATDDQAVTGYYASESAVTPQAGDSGWDNYSTSVSYSFDNATAGTKTVNIWFKDAAGNVTQTHVSDLIVFQSLGKNNRIEAGNNNSCAISDNNTAICWGNFGWTSPISVPSDLGEISDIASGYLHACAIVADNSSVRCWGSNYSGEQNIPTGFGVVKDISAGGRSTCALLDNGSIDCWGSNSSGQYNVPSTDLKAVSLSSSKGDHYCATYEDSSVKCWGKNSENQSTVPSGLSNVKDISAGSFHTCAVLDNQSVECWGAKYTNSYYGLIDVPQNLGPATKLAVGWTHTCAILDNQSVECWGNNQDGQLNVPSGLTGAVEISSGNSHSCALIEDKSVQCWGSGSQAIVPPELR